MRPTLNCSFMRLHCLPALLFLFFIVRVLTPLYCRITQNNNIVWGTLHVFKISTHTYLHLFQEENVAQDSGLTQGRRLEVSQGTGELSPGPRHLDNTDMHGTGAGNFHGSLNTESLA